MIWIKQLTVYNMSNRTPKKKISVSKIKEGIKNVGRTLKGRMKEVINRRYEQSLKRLGPARESGLEKIRKEQVDRASGYETKKKKTKKSKVVVNNKMKCYGQMDTKTNLIEVNVKKHKNDKTELANTIHHEMLHVKYPKMKEKEVKDKADRDTVSMSQTEKDRLVAKIRMKKINYKSGAIKRKLHMSSSKTKPGDLIESSNKLKRIGIMGLI